MCSTASPVPTRRPTSRRRRKQASFVGRSAVAVVELAVCLPLLVMITLATIEACAMIYTQQALHTTAFEGCRVGIVPGAEVENVNFQCQSLLEDHGVEGFTISMDPADPEDLSEGDWFTVTINAPFVDNSLVGGWLYNEKLLTRTVALRAE
ncbi:TadE-like protein [Rubripirellula lacrimiformis]|uniref:TadE-like protein n=1 Tax=Rubripirellula lacrimiformis TaxID=1930273 RepID=A0A517NBM5_9BACT|nr:TadE family protein [Rubripirellula lacrimiformis]QDT04537.1 TadE-like protein [Rubripirellula lacrimiformis]